MELNSLLFPAPTSKYTAEDLDTEAMYIPRFLKFTKTHQRILKSQSKLSSFDKSKKPEATSKAVLKPIGEINASESMEIDRPHGKGEEISSFIDGAQGSHSIRNPDIEEAKGLTKSNTILMEEGEVGQALPSGADPRGRGGFAPLGSFQNVSVLDTSKLDLSEIQEEKPIAEPIKNFSATDRNVPRNNLMSSERVAEPKQQLFTAEEHSTQQSDYDKVKKENIMQFFRKYDKRKVCHYIPCLHLPFPMGASKIILYFHANAEDIVLAQELLDFLRAMLKVHIVAVEYPGYGIYTEEHQQRATANLKTAYAKYPNMFRQQAKRTKIFDQTPRFGFNTQQPPRPSQSTPSKPTKKASLSKPKQEPEDLDASYEIILSDQDSDDAGVESHQETIRKVSMDTRMMNCTLNIQNKNSKLLGRGLTTRESAFSSDEEEDDAPRQSFFGGKPTQYAVHETAKDNVFEANEENILDDALYVYDYFNKVMGIEEKNIIIFGRSVGSGPATHIASKRNPGCLLLMSSFKSIRAVAQDQAGSYLKYLIQDRFKNIEKIEKVQSPTFFVHGMQDQLIPFTHAKDLHDKCSAPCSLILPARMSHNDFDFNEDLITPFYHFMKQCNISTREPRWAFKQMKIPEEYFIIPRAYRQKSIPAMLTWGCCCAPNINRNYEHTILLGNNPNQEDFDHESGQFYPKYAHIEFSNNESVRESLQSDAFYNNPEFNLNKLSTEQFNKTTGTKYPKGCSLESYMQASLNIQDIDVEVEQQLAIQKRAKAAAKKVTMSQSPNTRLKQRNLADVFMGASQAKNQSRISNVQNSLQHPETPQLSPNKPEIEGLQGGGQPPLAQIGGDDDESDLM